MEASGHKSSWSHSVDERLCIIRDSLVANPSMQERLPGLKSILDDYLNPHSDFGTDAQQESFHRRLLQIFRDSEVDQTYMHWLEKLRPDEQQRVKDFVAGDTSKEVGRNFEFGPSLGVREHMKRLVESKPVFVKGLSSKREAKVDSLLSKLSCGLFVPFRGKKEDPDSIIVSLMYSGMFYLLLHLRCYSRKLLSLKKLLIASTKVYEDADFQNWGLVVEYKPKYTCIPATVGGIQKIVKYAKTHNMGVRCAGFRMIFSRGQRIHLFKIKTYESLRSFLVANIRSRWRHHHIIARPL